MNQLPFAFDFIPPELDVRLPQFALNAVVNYLHQFALPNLLEYHIS